MSRLVACGVTHRTAAIGQRELLAVPAGGLVEECRALARRVEGECLVLSTCNRVEAYAFGGGDALGALRGWFLERGGAPLATSLSYWGGTEAVRHAFRVASGLDSMVVGEGEILGQVRTAYLAAVEAGTAGRALNLTFQAALAAGKWVRGATPLSAGISSVGGAAAVLAGRVFSRLSEQRVLILGAGRMAEASARHLLERRARPPVVANRSPENAHRLAAALGGETAALDEALGRLGEFDIVICSTASPRPIVTWDRVAEAVRLRRGRPVFLVDLGVPRNVEAAVAGLEGAVLYDIDALEGVVADSLRRRGAAVDAASAAIDDRVERFAAARAAELGLAPEAALSGFVPAGAAA